jgi:hypothetical protein
MERSLALEMIVTITPGKRRSHHLLFNSFQTVNG